ncbi:unnamed protein product [Diatraea saccharalis]|uniref:BED-type domain-containing protein n=1 Tax=Diatraea saccharalis TaxID=40085 RepID=A0A9N9MZT4_9NEOP|nr:unnamed protein product [Diatraea saccharalis]
MLFCVVIRFFHFIILIKMSSAGKSGISTVWKCFEKTGKNSAKCKLCFKAINTSGNTTNMMKHLRLKHSSVAVDVGMQIKRLATSTSNDDDANDDDSSWYV